MGIVRWILGTIILFYDRLFQPKPLLSRSADAQAKVNQEEKSLVLYQMNACPFCVKVRRHMKRLGLNFEMRDVIDSDQYRRELEKGGGMIQVPCLKITDKEGSERWMYESSDINTYLTGRFGTA